MSEKTAWGYQSDNDESLKSKQGGKFGLVSAFITKFEYNATAGKDESPADAVDITVMVGDKEYRSRIYDITGGIFKGDNKIEDGEPGYNELYNSEKKQREAVIVHVCKAFGVTEEQIKAALVAGNVNSFATWAFAICNTKGPDFAQKPVDVFLEYQWKIGDDNERTFLQLPKNMKGGRFLCPALAPAPAVPGVAGIWEEVRDANGLRYVDSAKNEHTFTRSANYMESPKSYQQVEGEDNAPETGAGAPAGQPGAPEGAPKKSKW
jgi:hypothetical protein